MADEVTKELSQEEVYTKIETEKIVKAKKKKKIATIVSLCAFLALAVTIIVLATVPANLRPSCVSSDFYRVNFYNNYSSSAAGTAHKADHKEKYENFVNDLNKCFSESYISAIFSGSLSKYDVTEKKTSDFESTAKKAEELGTSKYIELIYENAQVFTNRDGSKYQTKNSTSKVVEWTISFKKVYIVVNEENGFKDTNIYICADYTKKEGDTETVESSSKFIKVTLRANTYKIFENWDCYVD